MKTETLHDILKWTKNHHQHLSDALKAEGKASEGERPQLILGYLSDQEKHLSELLANYDENASDNALNTWCYDYLENNSLQQIVGNEDNIAAKSPEQIVAEVERQHNNIIGLYKHLKGRVGTPSAIDLLDKLIDLEQHEAMRMAQTTNRFSDM